MKTRAFIALLLGFTLLGALTGCGGSTEEITGNDRLTLIGFFKLDPRATYLHTCSDSPLDAVPILLSDYNLVPGDSIYIKVVGEYDNGNNPSDGVVAVFSSNATLLQSSEAHRVPGAIKAGEDFDTGTTWFCGNEPNDIPEDFNCTPDVAVTVPANATHLFISVRDSYYEDNTDDDDDFGVRISKFGQ